MSRGWVKEEEVGDAENHLKAEGKAIPTSSDT